MRSGGVRLAGLNQLNDRKIKAASTGKLNDGGGLWLRLTDKGKGFWFYRYTAGSRRPELGLGSYPETSLAQARQHAQKWPRPKASKGQGETSASHRSTDFRPAC